MSDFDETILKLYIYTYFRLYFGLYVQYPEYLYV